MVHKLKTWPDYFQAIWEGRKRCEVRKNDRNFQQGDILLLEEYDQVKGQYSGRFIRVHVTHLIHGGQLGIQPGYCLMSIIER